tara:strand:- start:81 stop:629 length:549 start_codon:yes stop_codon:yes gene_type:complete
MLGITALAQSPISALGGTNANVALSGIQLTSSIGQQILPNVEVTLTGQQLGFTIGTYSVSAAGNVTIITGVDHAIDMSIGSVTTAANATVSLTGMQLAASLGQSTIIPNSIISVTGQLINTSIGSVTTSANANVTPSGIQMTGSVGNLFITAWAVIDPNVTNTWTEVNKNISNTWTEVDKAA